MNTSEDSALGLEDFGPTSERFSPVARYYQEMDFLLYLNADCAYRADRVDAFLTLLWHPKEERLVGLKLKGFRFLFDQIKAITSLQDADFLPLVRVIEIALVGGVAETAMDQIEQQRMKKKYDTARQFAEEEKISVGPDVFKEAA